MAKSSSASRKQKPKARVLGAEFFDRPTLKVSRELLGKVLCRRSGGWVVRSVVTEVEAYDGFDDKASHAARRAKGGKVGRSVVMFGDAGHFYVYLCYGVHWMLNIVTRERGYPAAILIRGCDVASGPGRLTRRFRIGRALNKKLCHPNTGLWIEDHGFRFPSKSIIQTPRIGVDYAGPIWSKKPWRFVVAEEFKSGPSTRPRSASASQRRTRAGAS